MKIVWNKKIDSVEAVLLLLHESVDTTTSESQLSINKITIKEVFNDVSERLSNVNYHIPNSEKLVEAIHAIRKRMNNVGLNKNSILLPILWIRLMKEVGVLPTQNVMSKIPSPPVASNSSKSLRLYLYRNEESSGGRGVKKHREGFGEVRGYIETELLEIKKTNPTNWPYSCEWVTIRTPCISKKIKNATSGELIQPQISLHTSKRVTNRVTSENPITSLPLKKRKKRSAEEIKRVCGSVLYEAIKIYLEKESNRRNSSLALKGRNRRPYESSLSLDALVHMLQNKSPHLKKYKASTLKSALPHFVSCPRGRPEAKYKDENF